jgi:hypothetical protein
MVRPTNNLNLITTNEWKVGVDHYMNLRSVLS